VHSAKRGNKSISAVLHMLRKRAKACLAHRQRPLRINHSTASLLNLLLFGLNFSAKVRFQLIFNLVIIGSHCPTRFILMISKIEIFGILPLTL
jgi:hypothetical protein